MKAKIFCLSLALEHPHQALDAYMSFVGVMSVWVWCGVGVMCLVLGRRLQAHKAGNEMGVCKSGKWGCFVKKWKMGRYFFVKKVDLSLTQGALCTVGL